MVNKTQAVVDVEETSNPNVKKTMKNEAFRVQNALVKQMTLRGKYGISKFLVSIHEYVYIFYMFDVPVVSGALCLGYGIDFIQNVHKTQIFPKMLILMVMCVESLTSHLMGPGISSKRKAAQEALAGPFKGPTCSCDHGAGGHHHHNHAPAQVLKPEAAPVDSAMGLINKEKES
jgi:hypothetical protein